MAAEAEATREASAKVLTLGIQRSVSTTLESAASFLLISASKPTLSQNK